MATVCAGTLALMDAGVPIKKPVTGIAMGLITDKAYAKYAVLSDILGDEDHLGDMDFKVTGTRRRYYRYPDGYQSRRTFLRNYWRQALEQARDEVVCISWISLPKPYRNRVLT